MQQYNHYQSLRELLLHSPAQDSPHLCEIVMFIGQVKLCVYVLGMDGCLDYLRVYT